MASEGSSQQLSEMERASRHDISSERSSYTHQSAASCRSRHGDDEDMLLRTIKAQHSLSRQMTDEMSETSALLTPNMVRVGGTSSVKDQSASETEL